MSFVRSMNKRGGSEAVEEEIGESIIVENPRGLKGTHKMVVIGHLEGMRNVEISEALNLTQSAVSQILGRVDVQREIRRLSESRNTKVIDATSSVRKRLHQVALEAVNTTVDLMRSAEDERVRASCASDLAKMSGTLPKVDMPIQPQIPRLVIVTKNFSVNGGNGGNNGNPIIDMPCEEEKEKIG